METQQYNTFKFFRQYFNLPRSIALQWCVVEEASPRETEFRLGIALKGTDLYIDVAMRRFFSRIDCPAIRRSYCLAKRVSKKDCYEYRPSNGQILSKPKHYIRDIYSSSWYDKEFLNQSFL